MWFVLHHPKNESIGPALGHFLYFTMTITLKDNPATKLDLLVEQAQQRRIYGHVNPSSSPRWSRAQARDVLWALGTYQEDEAARRLFMGLYQALEVQS